MLLTGGSLLAVQLHSTLSSENKGPRMTGQAEQHDSQCLRSKTPVGIAVGVSSNFRKICICRARALNAADLYAYVNLDCFLISETPSVSVRNYPDKTCT